MVRSMTGLGSAEISFQGNVIAAEIKSFNNRFLEVSCRLSPVLTPYEKEIKDLVRNSVQRGKLYVNVSVQGENPESLGLRINAQKVKAIARLLDELRQSTGIGEKPTLDHFLKFSEILEPETDGEASEGLWEAVRSVMQSALDRLRAMREAEGAALAADLDSRADALSNRVGEVEARAKDRMHETYERMRERVRALIANTELDENRLHLEVALLSDRLDVTEECVRMRSHLDALRKTLHGGQAAGKKLTFLLQEMNREVNTICAKANDTDMSHCAVDMKDEIEKAREQAQNIE